jgi:hypothetical protein
MVRSLSGMIKSERSKSSTLFRNAGDRKGFRTMIRQEEAGGLSGYVPLVKATEARIEYMTASAKA